MTTIKQFFQNSPTKANELFAKLVDTTDSAVKTRGRLFVELKTELDHLARLEEEHLFPVLKGHKETKELVSAAVNDNEQIRRLVLELEPIPKESGEFAAKVLELRKVFQRSVRDDRSQLLPAVLKALSDDKAQALVETIESRKAAAEAVERAEADQRRAEARQEREKAAALLAEQEAAAKADADRRRAEARVEREKAAELLVEQEAAAKAEADQRRADVKHERELAARVLAEKKVMAEREQQSREAAREAEGAALRSTAAAAKNVRTSAETAAQVVTAPLSTGSVLWDAMFNLWSFPPVRSVDRSNSAELSTEQEEVVPLAEETLVVGKHTVESGRTTLRRYVVETPVEQRVTMYDERVVVERRRPVTDARTGETLTELTVEMIETSERPIVGKSVKVVEEVVLRRERVRRVETVRDTVRRDEVEIARTDEDTLGGKRRTALAHSRK